METLIVFQLFSPILVPGHLAEVGQDPACAKIPLHTLPAGETSQACLGPPDVPKCPVHGQPMDNFGGTGLCLQLPLHYQVKAGACPPVPHPPDEDAGGKHDSEWHKWEHPGKASHSGRRSWCQGQCVVPSFCLFSANALCFLESSTALLERQRLWQSLPLRLQDPLPGPGLSCWCCPHPPSIWVTSPAVPGHGVGWESRGAAWMPRQSLAAESLLGG